MKKIFAILLCALMICTLSVSALAEDTDGVEVDSSSPTEEIVTESVFEGVETKPELTTEMIVRWVTDNYEEITVILAVIAAALLIVQRITMVIKSISTCNNNAVVIAEDSKALTQAALNQVNTYKDAFEKLLLEVRQTDEEKRNLATALANVESFLKNAKLANVELANEVAELLVLANIPNSKKEELYSRHRAAVDAIDAVATAVMDTEVTTDDGHEA